MSIEEYKKILETIFNSDADQYPKTIEWDTGDPNPDTNTQGKCTLELAGLIVHHKRDMIFSVTRLFMAESSTTGAIHPHGPRPCHHIDLVTLGVTLEIKNGKIKFRRPPKVNASNNECLNGTRGQTKVSLLFNSFIGIDITP